MKRSSTFAESSPKRLAADGLPLDDNDESSSYEDTPPAVMSEPSDPPGPPRRNTKSRAWEVTWNNPPPRDEVEKAFKECGADEYVYQWEAGNEEGTLHIQGACYWKNKASFSHVKGKFPKAHVAQSSNWHRLKNYCSKKETRVEGPFRSSNSLSIKDPLHGKQLFAWQQKVVDILKEEPNDRTIYWFVDTVGCHGKTSLAKHICLSMEDSIFLTGKAADMKYGVFSYIESKKTSAPRVVMIDLVRSQEHFFSYQGLEEVKNGIFYNTKYESKMVLYDCPHVIVFANWPPEKEKLSMDRWKIFLISDENDLIEIN